MVKRIRFQSMGRVFRYRKRSSHLTIILEEKAHPKPKAVDTVKAKAMVAEGDAGAVSTPVKAKVEKKKTVKAATKSKKPSANAKKAK